MRNHTVAPFSTDVNYLLPSMSFLRPPSCEAVAVVPPDWLTEPTFQQVRDISPQPWRNIELMVLG
jgi:hypothetical protein